MKDKYTGALRAVSSTTAIMHAMNPYKVAEVMGGVWVGVSGERGSRRTRWD